ncbi:MAG: MraY family glycosyltransferase [Anaerolineae bacterium]|jgi:UDP-GlcNAc:undecaprenyl-phosphate GlcNAc-1-phosphate transferase
MTPVIAVFCAAVLFALVGTPAARSLAFRLGLIAIPRSDRAHREPTAMMGGVAIYLGATVSLLVGGALAALLFGGWRGVDELAAILAGATLMGAVGLWDDRVRLRPWPKVLLQLAAVIPAIAAGVQVRLPLPHIVNIALTFAWVLYVTNALNFSDNMDGVAGGIAAVAAAFYTLIAAMNGQYLVSALAAATLGATLGFLRYNLPLPKASIFMGDAGALFLGYVLSMLGIKLRFPANTNLLTWMVPVLVLGVPLFDTTMVFISRLRRHVSPLRGGVDHTSHRLARLGLGPLAATLALDLAGSGLGLIAVFVMQASLAEGYAVGVLALLLACYALWRLEWKLSYELRVGVPQADSYPLDESPTHRSPTEGEVLPATESSSPR